MKYASVHRAWLASDTAALDADDAALGAWLRLVVHAADLELGEGDRDFGEGRIPCCQDWSGRAWLRAVGTDRGGVEAAVEAGLARWDGNDLLVRGYDLRAERAYQARRTNASMPPRPGSRPRGRPAKSASKAGGKAQPGRAECEREASEKPLTLPTSALPGSAVQSSSPNACAREPNWVRVVEVFEATHSYVGPMTISHATVRGECEHILRACGNDLAAVRAACESHAEDPWVQEHRVGIKHMAGELHKHVGRRRGLATAADFAADTSDPFEVADG